MESKPNMSNLNSPDNQQQTPNQEEDEQRDLRVETLRGALEIARPFMTEHDGTVGKFVNGIAQPEVERAIPLDIFLDYEKTDAALPNQTVIFYLPDRSDEENFMLKERTNTAVITATYGDIKWVVQREPGRIQGIIDRLYGMNPLHNTENNPADAV